MKSDDFFFEKMNEDLRLLGEGAQVKEVPKSKIPTRESIEKMNERLSIIISDNENKALLSYKQASQFVLR